MRNGVGILVSVIVHATVLGVLFFVDPPDREPPKARTIVKVNIAKLPKPKPPKAKPPEPPKPEIVTPPEPKPEPKPTVVESKKPEDKKPPKKKKPKKREKKKKKPEPDKPVEKPPEKPPEKPQKKTKKFSYDMPDGPGGTMALPSGEGGSRVGDVEGDEDGVIGQKFEDRNLQPAEEKKPAEEEVAKISEVTTRPKLVGRPTERELRAAYPDSARRAGVEADVKIRVLVDAQGRVAKVKVLKSVGGGFDEAARKLAKKLRFRPAKRGGKPVAVWVTFPFKFRLDD